MCFSSDVSVGSKTEGFIWIDSISPHLRPLWSTVLMHRLPSARWSPCSQPDNSAALTHTHTHTHHLLPLPAWTQSLRRLGQDDGRGHEGKDKKLCRAAAKQVMCEMRPEEMNDERRRRQWDMRGTGRKTRSWGRDSGRWRRLRGLCGTKTDAGGEEFNVPLTPAPVVNHHQSPPGLKQSHLMAFTLERNCLLEVSA